MTFAEIVAKYDLAPGTIVYHNMPDIVACAVAFAEWRAQYSDLSSEFRQNHENDLDKDCAVCKSIKAANAFQAMFEALRKEAGHAEQ